MRRARLGRRAFCGAPTCIAPALPTAATAHGHRRCCSQAIARCLQHKPLCACSPTEVWVSHPPTSRPLRTLLRSAGARPDVRKKARASLSATRPSWSASASANQASTTLSGTPSTGQGGLGGGGGASPAGGACACCCCGAGGGAVPVGRIGAGPDRRLPTSGGSRSCKHSSREEARLVLAPNVAWRRQAAATAAGPCAPRLPLLPRDPRSLRSAKRTSKPFIFSGGCSVPGARSAKPQGAFPRSRCAPSVAKLPQGC